MTEKSDREELQRRLEQAKRAAALGNDPVTAERLQKLVKELEAKKGASAGRPSGHADLRYGAVGKQNEKMIDAAECRRQATEWVDQARRESSTRIRTALMCIARSWTSLADQMDRLEAFRDQQTS